MKYSPKIPTKSTENSPHAHVEMSKKRYVDRLRRISPKRSKTETLEIV